MSTSATGGYLSPTTARPNFNHLIHDLIVGITSLDNTVVRPRNQKNPPPPPSFGTDWIAYGLSTIQADGFAYVADNTTVSRQESFVVSVAIYGDNAEVTARNLRDGLEIVQNWEAVKDYIRFVGSDNIMRVPELHNGRWLKRYDFSFSVRQSATQTYNILTIESKTTSPYDSVSVGLVYNS